MKLLTAIAKIKIAIKVINSKFILLAVGDKSKSERVAMCNAVNGSISLSKRALDNP